MKKVFVLGLILTLIGFGCAKKEQPQELRTMTTTASDPLESSFSQFRTALVGNDYLKALLSLRSTLEMFWEKSPLLLHNLKFVKSDSNSYGIFDPKDGDAFSSGEPIYLYLEPVGYTIKKNLEGGFNEFGFTADFSLEDESGKILGGQSNFAHMPFKSWNFNTEVALTFTFSLSGLGKGKYKIMTTVKDAFSERTASAEKWFSII